MIDFKATDKWYKEAAETETDCPEISAGLEPLGEEFAKVYWDNHWKLYE